MSQSQIHALSTIDDRIESVKMDAGQYCATIDASYDGKPFTVCFRENSFDSLQESILLQLRNMN